MKELECFISKIAFDTRTVISPNDQFYKSCSDRLNIIQQKCLSVYKEFIKKFKNTEWKGTYAELVFLSFFLKAGFNLEYEKILTSKQSLLRTNQELKPDIYLKSPYNLSVEIKSFTTQNKIIDGIIKAVKKSKTKVWDITADYPYDVMYIDDQLVRKEIRELKSAVNSNVTFYYSCNFPLLKFTIHREKQDMTISKHGYNAYEFAFNFKYYILNHAEQILDRKTNVLAYLISQKFNYSFINGFDWNTGLRALARRFFIELPYDNSKIDDVFHKNWNTNKRVSTIAKRITAVLFYVDFSDKQQDKFFFFKNPNVNKLNQERDGMKQFKMQLDFQKLDVELIYDDFEHDNY